MNANTVLLTNRIARSLWQRFQRTYAVRRNVALGKNVHIGVGTILDAPHRLIVADHVYIGKYCTVECDGQIGRWVMIANHVGIIGRYDHNFRCVGKGIIESPWVGDRNYDGPGTRLDVTIEDDIWVGFGAIILSGVRIGRGAVIGAGSVVTKDVAPYSIVTGNPATERGKRFTAIEIDQHESLLYGGGH
jgi:acetyltransferase-like isoleucine patch superfamily enzyme